MSDYWESKVNLTLKDVCRVSKITCNELNTLSSKNVLGDKGTKSLANTFVYFGLPYTTFWL